MSEIRNYFVANPIIALGKIEDSIVERGGGERTRERPRKATACAVVHIKQVRETYCHSAETGASRRTDALNGGRKRAPRFANRTNMRADPFVPIFLFFLFLSFFFFFLSRGDQGSKAKGGERSYAIFVAKRGVYSLSLVFSYVPRLVVFLF